MKPTLTALLLHNPHPWFQFTLFVHSTLLGAIWLTFYCILIYYLSSLPDCKLHENRIFFVSLIHSKNAKSINRNISSIMDSLPSLVLSVVPPTCFQLHKLPFWVLVVSFSFETQTFLGPLLLNGGGKMKRGTLGHCFSCSDKPHINRQEPPSPSARLHPPGHVSHGGPGTVSESLGGLQKHTPMSSHPRINCGPRKKDVEKAS